MAYESFALVYDRLMADMPYPRWVEFAEAAFARHGRPSVIAELGCGTGSVTIPLAERGYRVYGIDLSEAMLSIAQSKSGGGLYNAAFEPIWLQQDMTEWELAEPVDAVVSFCDCLNYVTEADQVADVFRQTYSGLKPGGLFLFDVHTPATLAAYADNQPYVYNEPDLSYIWECAFDEELICIDHELTFFAREADGKRYTRFDETHTQRAYPLEQLQAMLEEAGFRGVRIYGDFSWEQADEGTERAFFVAQKPLS